MTFGDQPFSSGEFAERLRRDRIILVTEPIDDNRAKLVIAQLLWLDHLDAKADIRMLIRSPGGVVTSTLGILDAMQDVAPDIATIAAGGVGGTAIWLVAKGTQGKREAVAEASFQFTGFRDPNPDAAIRVVTSERERLAKVMYDMLATCTGRASAEIERACVERWFVDADEGVQLGIVDRIRSPR